MLRIFVTHNHECNGLVLQLNGNTVWYVRWSSLDALLRTYCGSKHIKYFAHDELATEEEYYGVIWTRSSMSFHGWTGINGAAL